MTFYIYNRGHAVGIRVIIDNLIRAFARHGINAFEVDTLANCPKTACVIPYGVLESWYVAKSGYETKLALLVDAISLGYRNKIVFYFKKRHIFHFDFFYSIYGFLRYSRMEKRVIKKYENVMLVSQTDIDYLKRRNQARNKSITYWCVPNGVNEVDVVRDKSVSDKMRIGVLSSFNSRQSFEENNWFFRSIYKKYSIEHSDIELIVAGRGRFINHLRGLRSVTVLGEVDDLNDFFSNIDVFLSLNPKGCGILNRVLDAIAYRTAVIGVNGSFSGFSDSTKFYLCFDNYDSFCSTVNDIKNESLRLELIGKAESIIKEKHNWVLNYDRFVQKILLVASIKD